LPDGQRSQIDRHDSVLSERQAIVGMRSNLKDKVAILALVHHFAFAWFAHWQPAQDEWS
jgi:hypothetical protein